MWIRRHGRSLTLLWCAAKSVERVREQQASAQNEKIEGLQLCLVARPSSINISNQRAAHTSSHTTRNSCAWMHSQTVHRGLPHRQTNNYDKESFGKSVFGNLTYAKLYVSYGAQSYAARNFEPLVGRKDLSLQIDPAVLLLQQAYIPRKTKNRQPKGRKARETAAYR